MKIIEHIHGSNNMQLVIAHMTSIAMSDDKKTTQQFYINQLLSFMLGDPIHYSKDEYGKPYLTNNPYHISISHSKEYLAVMISEKNCGIDLQYLTPKVTRVRNKFLSEMEINYLVEKQSLYQLTILWCAKEAVYKQNGRQKLEFKNAMQISPFIYAKEGHLSCRLLTHEIDENISLYYKSYELDGDTYILVFTN